jgi:hypothetical protein
LGRFDSEKTNRVPPRRRRDAHCKQTHIAKLHARSAIFQQRQRVLTDLWPVIHTINVSLIMGLKAGGFVASILK